MKAIIIGTSATLLDKKNGNVIDSFDFVARSVSAAPYHGYEEYIGTKTNMFWSKFQFLYRLQFLKPSFYGKLLLLFSDPDNYYEGYVPSDMISTRYNRLFFDLWSKEFIAKYPVEELLYLNDVDVATLHVKTGFKQQYMKGRRPVYSSAGLRVIDYFIKSKKYTEIFVTGFSFFDKGTYFDRAENHAVHEHCFYKEKLYYNKLITEGLIYEL